MMDDTFELLDRMDNKHHAMLVAFLNVCNPLAPYSSH
jgi:hypothetical protein